MRLAREFGTVDQLIPDGVDGLTDLPYPVFEAIRAGLVYVGFDELTDDERPPRSMWHRPDKLKDWFDDVRARRNKGADGWNRDIEDPVQNDAAAGLIVGG